MPQPKRFTKSNLLDIVPDMMSGSGATRQDCKIEISGVPFDVSVYFMFASLVRIDIKKPKVNSSKGKK